MRKFLLGLCAGAFALTLSAQQLEPNSPGASLTRAGANPTPGGQFTLYANQGIDFRVGGNPSMGYILAMGTLATTSTQPLLIYGISDYLDLDQSAGIQIIGDGISFTSALPGNWFTTNGVGVSNWNIPTNPTMWGSNLDMQAIVADPAAPPFNLNFSAAGRWAITGLTVSTFYGDDSTLPFAASHSYMLYGAARTQFVFCTNGQFTAGPVGSSSYFESGAAFDAGLATNEPSFAVLWDDMYMMQANGRAVNVVEDPVNGWITCEWFNAQYFALTTGTIGTFKATITDLGGICQVDYDYSAFVGTAVRGVIGISDANTTTTNTSSGDLVTTGVVNAYSSPAGGFDTHYEDFNTSGALDVAGTVMHWIDATGNGDWTIF